MNEAILKRLRRMEKYESSIIEADEETREKLYLEMPESKEEDKIGTDILEKHYGINEKAWWEFDFKAREINWTEDDLKKKIKKIFINGNITNKDREEIQGLCEKYRASHKEARNHRIAQMILKKPIGKEEAEKILREHPANAPYEEKEAWGLPGWFFLQDSIINRMDELSEPLPEDRFSHFENVTSLIAKTAEKLKPKQAALIFRDSLEEMINKRIGLNGAGVGKYALYTGASYLFNGDSESIDLFEQGLEKKEDYENLSEKEIEIAAIIPRSISRHEITHLVSEGSEKLRKEKIDPSLVRELILARPEEERLEFFEHVIERPEIARVFKIARGRGINSSDFTSSLEMYENCTFNEKSYLQTLRELSETPRSAQVIPLAIRKAENLITDPKSERIIDIAKKSSAGEFLLEKYFTTVEAGKTNQAELLLRAGEQITDQGKLSVAISRIGSIPDNLATAYIEANYPIEGMDKILRTLAPASTNKEKVEVKRYIPRSLDEVFEDEARRGVISQENRDNYELAKEVLGEHAQKRMRTLYREGIDGLVKFCQDVVQLKDSKGLQVIIDSDQLFNK